MQFFGVVGKKTSRRERLEAHSSSVSDDIEPK